MSDDTLWGQKRCAEFLGFSYDHFRKVIRYKEGVPRVDPLRQRICGIYFLMRGKEITYVGQSIDILGRIKSSARGGTWGVTGFAYFECEREDLSKLERTLILGLKPKRNSPPSRPWFLCVPSLRNRGNIFVRISR